jgi:hypothetical protein
MTFPGLWRGWTNVPAGEYELAAHAVGESGTSLTSPPVHITVLDLDLRIYRGTDHKVVLSLGMGAMVMGGYDFGNQRRPPDLDATGTVLSRQCGGILLGRPTDNVQVRFYRAVFIPPNTR